MEEIPLPVDRIRAERPIHIEARLDAFGGQRFAFRFDYNSVGGRWIVEIEHLQREFIVTRSAVEPYRLYTYRPFVSFLFADPTGTEVSATPTTLGDPIRLWALPGPGGQPPDES